MLVPHCDAGLSGQRVPGPSEGHSKMLKQSESFLVIPSGCDDRDLQATNPVDIVVVDFREDHLFPDSQGVVS